MLIKYLTVLVFICYHEALVIPDRDGTSVPINSPSIPNYGGADGTSSPTPSQHFDNRFSLNVEKTVWLFWSANDTDKSIVFEIHAKTHGYVGFGLSPNGKMYPSDVVVGWVKDGQTYFKDYHTIGHSHPVVDPSQDWHLLGGSEDDKWTVLKFTRSLDTCDENDTKIEEDTVRVIYSFNDLDPASYTDIPYHGATQRGAQSLMLLSSSLTDADVHIPDDVISFDLAQENFNVPSKDTTYQCKTFRMPTLGRKHHMIKFSPLITKGNELNVHHMVVYACLPGYHVDSKYDNMTYDCTEGGPRALWPCRSNVIIAWAVGGTDYLYPEEAGVSMGTDIDPEFFLLETHFDNPKLESDIVDSSGIRIFLTPTLRQYDASLLEIGMHVNKLQFIPPYQSKFESKGYCTKKHLEQGLPEDGVNVFAVLQHAHLLAVGIRTRLFRNGTELKPLAEDQTYDFNYQNIRAIRPTRKLMRGDSLEVDCTLNSLDKTKPTYGGLSTHEEMCLSTLLYYPRMPLGLCLSSPKYDVIAEEPYKAVEIMETWQWQNSSVVSNFETMMKNSSYQFTAMFENNKNNPWQGEEGKEEVRLQLYSKPKSCV